MIATNLKRTFMAAIAAIAVAAPGAIAQPDNRLFPRGIFWQGCYEGDYENVRALVESPNGTAALEAAINTSWGDRPNAVIARMPLPPDGPYFYLHRYRWGQLNFTGFHQNGSQWQIQFYFEEPSPDSSTPAQASLESYTVIVEGGVDGNCEWSAQRP